MQKCESFVFSKKSCIILYGAATTGSIMLRQLKEQGYNVTCFIDKRAKEIDNNLGLDVYELDSEKIDHEGVVIIAVKNVFEHTNVANELFRNGFTNIIYRSIHVLEGNGNKNERKLNEAYDLIQAGKFSDLDGVLLPCTVTLDLPKLKLMNTTFLGDDVSIKLPVTMIFTDKKYGDADKEQPLVGFLPHIQFVDSVLGLPDGRIEGYLDFCRRSGEKVGTFNITRLWEENVVRNRAEVIMRMNHSYEMDQDFFYRASIRVKWNDERKCFNLCSGKHRAVFLLEKGLNYLPVKMSQNDFFCWKDFLGKKQTTENTEFYSESLVAPAENPWTYEIPCNNEVFFFSMIKSIAREIAKMEYDPERTLFDGWEIITNIADDGFLKRFFDRCNATTTYITRLDKNLQTRIRNRDKICGVIIDGDSEISFTNLDVLFDCVDFKDKNNISIQKMLFCCFYNGKLVQFRRIK